MKKNFLFLFGCILMMMTSCQQKSVQICIENPTKVTVSNRLASVDYFSLLEKLHLDSIQSFQLIDSSGNQIPYQITFDHKILFLVNLSSNKEIKILARPGLTFKGNTIACGNYYKWREDDIAWENDLSAYRIYGPALQKRREKSYGYDIWSKRKIHSPIVAERYDKHRNQKGSYHDDNGNGLDMYIVGPSLGAGTSAILLGDSIVMPYCYKEFKILDNGPYRFTLDLTYETKEVDDQILTEKRCIRCDAGTYMNRTEVRYEGATHPLDVISGIVMHDSTGLIPINNVTAIAYADPTGHNDKDGKIYVGMYSPQSYRAYTKECSDELSQKVGIYGHAVIQIKYLPETKFTYYWGAGWQKGWIKDAEAWKEQMKNEIALIENPLTIRIEK